MLKLTGKNLELYAAKHYKNHRCVDYEEFKDDLARFKYVKRLIRRYLRTNDIDVRLVLNHIILIYNVFEIEASNNIFKSKMNNDEMNVLKPFLVYTNFIEESVLEGPAGDIEIVNRLQKL